MWVGAALRVYDHWLPVDEQHARPIREGLERIASCLRNIQPAYPVAHVRSAAHGAWRVPEPQEAVNTAHYHAALVPGQSRRINGEVIVGEGADHAEQSFARTVPQVLSRHGGELRSARRPLECHLAATVD